MKHKIKLTNGGAVLLRAILSLPEQFKDPSQVLRAAYILKELEVKSPEVDLRSKESVENFENWAAVDFKELELTESQRDLIKESIKNNATKVPVSNVIIEIFEQFGFSA